MHVAATRNMGNEEVAIPNRVSHAIEKFQGVNIFEIESLSSPSLLLFLLLPISVASFFSLALFCHLLVLRFLHFKYLPFLFFLELSLLRLQRQNQC